MGRGGPGGGGGGRGLGFGFRNLVQFCLQGRASGLGIRRVLWAVSLGVRLWLLWSELNAYGNSLHRPGSS